MLEAALLNIQQLTSFTSRQVLLIDSWSLKKFMSINILSDHVSTDVTSFCILVLIVLNNNQSIIFFFIPYDIILFYWFLDDEHERTFIRVANPC